MVVVLVMAVASLCPSPSALEERIALAPLDELHTMLRACSSMAEQRRTLIVAAQAVLAVGEPSGIAAAAQAVLASAGAPSAGAAPPAETPSHPPPPSLQQRSSAPPSKRSELTTWHESVDEQQTAQRAQARAVATRRRAHKREVLVPVNPAAPADAPRRWTVECEPLLYGLGLPVVPQCTPTGPSRVSDGAMGCGRVLRDGFIDATEQALLLATVERAMRGLFHQGAQTSFAPDAKSALKHMGSTGHALFGEVQARVRRALEADFGLGRLYSAGSLLTRIWADDRVPRDGMDVDPGHKYDTPHVDHHPNLPRPSMAFR